MLHLLLRQLATSCWPFFSAYFFLGLLRRQTTIKMQTNWICVRKVWLFWLSVLRHKLTAQNGATNNNPCFWLLFCVVARVLATFLLLRTICGESWRAVILIATGCPVICLALVNAATLIAGKILGKKKICVCPTTMVTTTAAATTMLQTRVGRQFSTHFPWLLKLILLAEH